jgi:hypothetical protein
MRSVTADGVGFHAAVVPDNGDKTHSRDSSAEFTSSKYRVIR